MATVTESPSTQELSQMQQKLHELESQLERLQNFQFDLRDIQQAEERVAQADRKIEEIKAELKEAKEEHDAQVVNLRKLVRSAGRTMPLFNTGSCVGVASSTPHTAQPKADPAREDSFESWREVRLDTLAISEAILKRLSDAGIETIGQMTTYTAKNELSSIKGIGATKATKVDEALDRFWQQWNEDHPEELEPEDDPEDEDDTDDIESDDDESVTISSDEDADDDVDDSDDDESQDVVSDNTSSPLSSDDVDEEAQPEEIAEHSETTEGDDDDDFEPDFDDL